MTSTEKTQTTVRETIPPHLFSRIENEWQQMRSVAVATPRTDDRSAAAEVSIARG
ncbi:MULTISPECIES: hypothetical protein [unclassified Rhizobium]|uniref:hypothetical protein n=1 Tax=unclassified Rhizobium TaxID=2613769 RepID=UPI000AC1506F|nr:MULTISPECIES: hypothetical protein [unclassified Rhizobium]TCM55677.1 hypothetical protein C8J36_10341 [Rhizobium sp. PP-F2F-G48]